MAAAAATLRAGCASPSRSVRFLGSIGESAKEDGAAQRLRDAVAFRVGSGQRVGWVGWRWWRQDGADLDGFATQGAVGRFQRLGLVGSDG